MHTHIVCEEFKRFLNERVSGYVFMYTDHVVVLVIATNRECGW